MNFTQETIEALRGSYAQNGNVPEAALLAHGLQKAWVAPTGAVTGINAYNLEAPAKRLYPVLTPLRNKTPRVGTVGGTQANWRAITGINTSNMDIGVSDGNRGGVMAQTEVDYTAVFRELGMENYFTWAAQYAAEGFQDLPAETTLELLQGLMIAEEKVLLWGQGTWPFSQTPQPVLSAGSGGTFSNSTIVVYCVAMNAAGYARSSVASGIVQSITRTNIDGSVDTYGGGSAQVSPSQSITLSAGTSTQSITATVTAVPGAAAYAWFWGVSGSVLLGAVTTVNTVLITAAATGTQNITSLDTASDHSQNSLVFDGLVIQAAKAGSNAYYKSFDGGTLTGNGDGTIREIDAALQSFWDNYRLSPTTIWVNSQEEKNMRSKILLGSSNAAQRFVFETQQDRLVGGTMAISYHNPFQMSGKAKEIPIEIHPNMPPGTIFFETDVLPYPLSNVTNVARLLLRYDYVQIAWPMLKRRREHGIYFDGVLQHYFPPAIGLIQNIANG